MTPQRHKLARLRLEGNTYAEIAAREHLSIGTIYWHFKKIYSAIGSPRQQDFYLAYYNYCKENGLRTPNLGAILSALESKR